MMTTSKKERGRIQHSGMGGFLNPPTHPEHTMCIETDLRKRPENRGSMSLRAAVDCEWLDNATRAAARSVLKAWKPIPVDHPDVVSWVRKVLGYFRNCYIPESGSRNVSDLIIDASRNPLEHVDTHRGVDLIREFYPDFVPTADDFDNAKWGN